MDNTAIKNYGPGSLSDLAKMGGDIAGTLTNDEVKAIGPGSIPDLARAGGEIIEDAGEG